MADDRAAQRLIPPSTLPATEMPGISIISSLPEFVSRERHAELTSTTPSSFADLPAVLHHQEDNVTISLDPPFDGISMDDCASGTIYILSSAVVFMSTSGKGLSITYPTISLHAISRSGFGPSIYCQLDETIDAEEEPTPDQEEEMRMKELRINTQTEASLEPMFAALSHCAALNPDAMGEEEEEEDAFLDADEADLQEEEDQDGLTEAGRATLARLETLISDPQNLLGEDDSDGSKEEDPQDDPNLNSRQINGVHPRNAAAH